MNREIVAVPLVTPLILSLILSLLSIWMESSIFSRTLEAYGRLGNKVTVCDHNASDLFKSLAHIYTVSKTSYMRPIKALTRMTTSAAPRRQCLSIWRSRTMSLSNGWSRYKANTRGTSLYSSSHLVWGKRHYTLGRRNQTGVWRMTEKVVALPMHMLAHWEVDS